MKTVSWFSSGIDRANTLSINLDNIWVSRKVFGNSSLILIRRDQARASEKITGIAVIYLNKFLENISIFTEDRKGN
jgi:hypothetical protein